MDREFDDEDDTLDTLDPEQELDFDSHDPREYEPEWSVPAEHEPDFFDEEDPGLEPDGFDDESWQQIIEDDEDDGGLW